MKTLVSLTGVLLTFVLMSAHLSGLNDKALSNYRYAGAWQPSRISAADGITELDIKIGKFINAKRAIVPGHF